MGKATRPMPISATSSPAACRRSRTSATAGWAAGWCSTTASTSASPCPAPDGRFSFAYLAYHPDPHRFNARARPLLAAAGARVSLTESRHRNFIFFTALPGVSFTAFTHVVPDDPTEGEPRVAFGRYAERDGRLSVPVGLQVNHAFIDGAALGALVAAVERAYAEPG